MAIVQCALPWLSAETHSAATFFYEPSQKGDPWNGSFSVYFSSQPTNYSWHVCVCVWVVSWLHSCTGRGSQTAHSKLLDLERFIFVLRLVWLDAALYVCMAKTKARCVAIYSMSTHCASRSFIYKTKEPRHTCNNFECETNRITDWSNFPWESIGTLDQLWFIILYWNSALTEVKLI